MAGIQASEVSHIYRQRNITYRQAVQALSEGKVKAGFDLLDGMGAIKTLDPVNPFSGVAEDYIAALRRGKTALVISPTHRQGEQVTEAIRNKLRADGKLGQTDTSVPKLVNTNLTEAEKSDARNYKTGQIIQFNKNAPGLPRGSRWQVVAAKDDQVEIADTHGTIKLLPLRGLVSFDIFENAELELAIGDSIRITRNGLDANRKRLSNGQLLQVASINQDGSVMAYNKISKARYHLSTQFGHVAHAHCITSHASQGKTVDEVFIAQPASTFAASNLNQFYVSVSRAKERVHIYTDNKDALLAQVAESGDRLSALELVKRKINHIRTAEHIIRTRKPKPYKATNAAKAKPIPSQKKPDPSPPYSKRKVVIHAPRP